MAFRRRQTRKSGPSFVDRSVPPVFGLALLGLSQRARAVSLRAADTGQVGRWAWGVQTAHPRRSDVRL